MSNFLACRLSPSAVQTAQRGRLEGARGNIYGESTSGRQILGKRYGWMDGQLP